MNSWVNGTVPESQSPCVDNSVETFQTMLLTTEIESVNEQRLNQSGITFFEYDFPSSASDGLVDLVIWVDNANLHYSFVAVCEKEGKPVTYLGLFWWTCTVSPERRVESRTGMFTYHLEIAKKGSRADLWNWMLL